MQLTRTSWHYKIASCGKDRYWKMKDRMTICDYMRSLISGLTTAVVITAVLSALTYAFVVLPLTALLVSVLS